MEVVFETKLVETLGTKSPLPVELVPFGWQATQMALNRICQQSTLRHKGDAPFVSDNGNSILDCRFDWIVDPVATEMAINNIPGVVENGLFVHRADKVIVGTSAGIRLMER